MKKPRRDRRVSESRKRKKVSKPAKKVQAPAPPEYPVNVHRYSRPAF